ncbi:MAG: fumarylacetoacetate hydrolase family protein [bacterium]|nr:fumarylacetoacetate hydrolase family protein [bacterium]
MTFRREGSTEEQFGVLREDGRAVAFRGPAEPGRVDESDPLASVEAFLAAWPYSLARAEERVCELAASGDASKPLARSDVRLLPPVPRPPALFDFGLTPRHLRDAALGLVRREIRPPFRTAAVLLARLAGRRAIAVRSPFPYYRGDPCALIGDGEATSWPKASSYLDVEPELAVVVGEVGPGASLEQADRAIVGYTIFNDFSLRDLQWPVMLSLAGPSGCKDFDRSNGLGPCLVTPDQLADPLDQEVRVRIGDRISWSGSTREYAAHPREVVAQIASGQHLVAGSVIGLGTVPGCCSLETEQWLLPGDPIEITFDGIGTLYQRAPDRLPRLSPSRWRSRPELARFQQGQV